MKEKNSEGKRSDDKQRGAGRSCGLPGSRVPIPWWQSLALHEWETDKKRLWNPFTKKMEKERGTERKGSPLPPRFEPQSPPARRWQQFEASIISSSVLWHPYTSQLCCSAHHGQDVCLILMSHTHTHPELEMWGPYFLRPQNTVSIYYRRCKQNSNQWNNKTYTWVKFFKTVNIIIKINLVFWRTFKIYFTEQQEKYAN